MFIFEQLKLRNNILLNSNDKLENNYNILNNNTDNIDEIKISLVSKFSPEKDELINKINKVKSDNDDK